jgi:polyhydroxybutyrate depolymerase
MIGTVSRRVQGALALLSIALIACGSSPDDDAGSDADGASGRGGSGSASTPGRPSGSSPSGGPSSPDDPDPGNPPGSGGSAVASSGCGRAPALESGAESLEVDGQERTFILDLPSEYDRDTAYPVLFAFHGRGFSAAEFRSAQYGNLLSVAGDAAIVVHPDALGEPERAWDTDSMRDVRLFDALLEELAGALCIDESRVFATGHSSGGYFINLLACRRGDALRAIAPVAGGGPFGSDGDEPSCAGPVSAWIAHAEDDDTVLFENGENSRDYWLESASCSEDSFDQVAPSPCVAYEGCGTGLAVNWCAYEGGHDWPRFAAQGIWSFFERF